MPLENGTAIGPYTVLAKLGEGGMGEVYRARDSKLKRDVAIKVLPPDVAGDRERLARFQREAEVLAALNHPHIAHVYGIEEASASGAPKGAPYVALVMELVEGEDLAQRIARGPLPIDEAIAIAKQIAEALEAAHEQGIIHRDLKPANIKVRPDGTVKVLDFGLAKALDRLEGDGFSRRQGEAGYGSADAQASALQTVTSPAMTMHGMILGTAAYMSPEQAKGKPVDKRTDIWAFGCVLYEMLSGKRAFEGEDVTDTIAAVVTREPDWSRLPAATPAAVRQLLARCLAKDRKRRLRDVGDAHHEFADEAPTVVAPSPAPASRVAWLTTAAAALAAALLAIPAISHYLETAAPPLAMRLTIDAPPNSVRLLGPEISPDGRAVGFASIASSSPAPQLWIRRLDEPTPVPAPGPIFVNGSHFWSPDSRAIAALTRDGLLHLDLATGGTRILAPARSTMVGLSQFSGTWGPDGVILYGLGGTLHRVSEHGGDSRPVALEGLAPDADSRFPVFLPGGRRFLFLAQEQGQSYTYAASIDGGTVTRLFASDSQAVYSEPSPGRGHVLYVRDENLMAQPFDVATLTSVGAPSVVATGVPLFTAEFIGTGRAAFSVSPGGVLVYSSRSETVLQRLVWIDREGKEAGTVGDPALYFGPRISPDGTRVAVARLDGKTRLGDIYVLSEGGGSQRLTFDEANDLQPVWTPDGQHVIWGSQRGSTSMLVRKRADGSGAEEVLHRSEHPVAPDDVSSDGRHVVFRESHPTTRNDLWILPLDGSGKARPLLNTPADEPRARFSPDGGLIGYMSDASGRVDSYLQPFPDMNGKWQVTDGGGQVPQWRRDGRELYYYSATSIWSRPVLSLNPLQVGPAVRLFTPPATPRGSFFHAAADGTRFLFAPERFSPDSLKYQIALGWMKP